MIRITLLAFLALPARADLMSPGDLAAPHETLEGLSNCTKCHTAGEQLSQAACLDCHKEVRSRVQKNAGLHGRMKQEDRACEKCHADHQGREFDMIDWGDKGRKGFEHDRTGWKLAGAHDKVDCEKCHDERLITDQVVKKILAEAKPRHTTWLGVGTACHACHFDEHRDQVSDKCEECHNEAKWKPAPKFDHAKATFALRGAHAKVECVKCHPVKTDQANLAAFPAPRAREFAQFVDIASAKCTDCHEDVHKGRFGKNCLSCHTEDAWKPVKNTTDKSFHDKARFPLRGAHVSVACAACHGTPMKERDIPFEKCTDCHPDGHEGQLGATPDCARCHTEITFSRPDYGVPEHAQSGWPLEGLHREVRCELCHVQDHALLERVPATVRAALKKAKRPEIFSFARLRLPESKDACQGCHPDAHGGQLGAGLECARCHSPDGFQHVRYDVEEHAKSRWPLTGAHRAVACRSCHAEDPKLLDSLPNPVRAQLAKVGRRELVSLAVLHPRTDGDRCETCHEDVHHGQFEGWAKKGGCQGCHETESFHRLKFVHDRDSRYPLEGKHATVACQHCHPADSKGVVQYRPLDQACTACHADRHAGQFDEGSKKTDCTRCHTATGWKETTFRHEPPFTDYVLEGGHVGVACAACHVELELGTGRALERYRSTPRECEACHVDQHDGAFHDLESLFPGGAR